MNLTASDVERFWALVDKKTGPRGCWPWQGSTIKDGYGRFRIGSRADGSRRLVLAHRVAFFLATGHLPRVVRHDCDTPACCRPSHLLGGTQRDNMQDAIRRGRFFRKLTPDDILRIRTALAAGESQSVIATRYGVTQTLISRIKRGLLWKEVT